MYWRCPVRVTVSMKSQASSVSAWERRKSAQVVMLRWGRWVDAVGLEDLPDGGGGDLDTERGEFAVHPPVPPARVLSDQAQDEGAYGAGGGRAAGPLGPAGARVTLIHQVAVPAQDGVRSHQQPQAAQHLAGQGREKGSEEGPVLRREPHPISRHPVGAKLSLQDGDLMP
jgi:hypothetical protein